MWIHYFCLKKTQYLETRKIVVTGGPSTGKTSVIEQLESLGNHCLHEVIRSMTLKAKSEGKKVEMISNPIISVEDPMKFNLKILNARIEQYKFATQSQEKIIFFDRGTPDVLAYMDCFGQTYGHEFKETCATMRYDHIFLMPPWREIHVNDSGRFESFEESLRIYDCLKQTYERFSYGVTIVPLGTVDERIDFILNHLKVD